MAATFTAPGYSTVAGAITGVLLWSLQTYVFRGAAVPDVLQSAAWILIPALVTGIASLLTRRVSSPATPAVAPRHAAHP
jgi:hypothetical protein